MLKIGVIFYDFRKLQLQKITFITNGTNYNI